MRLCTVAEQTKISENELEYEISGAQTTSSALGRITLFVLIDDYNYYTHSRTASFIPNTHYFRI